ncbi:lachesin-like [Eriocheir sinensis]|uniref:lachesin-like n=1 Tax=Eriocheir sinensis TaxID=95602 RepID=UPI0021C75238|nr:lachesin-like [Eriocheir sinensis]
MPRLPAVLPANILLVTLASLAGSSEDVDVPRFPEKVPNITVTVGRDALLPCTIEQLKGFKVAWVQVDTQTILTIHKQVITRNPRIALLHNDHRSWHLQIRDVKESDRGWYMCQVNTDPMRSRQGYMDVVVPPDIIDQESSGDLTVREGEDVTLTCRAKGHPPPSITWRREDNQDIILDSTKTGSGLSLAELQSATYNGMKGTRLQHLHGNEELEPGVDMNHWGDMQRGRGIRGVGGVGRGGGMASPGMGDGKALGGVRHTGGKRQVVEGETLHLKRVSRLQMGSYLCIASNGIPPSVSKRAHLKVQFPPMTWVPQQLVGAYVGQELTLACNTEAFPKSINYWTNEHGDMIVSDDRYETLTIVRSYQVDMKLRITRMEHKDFGKYKCLAKNSLGETDGDIQVYEIEPPKTYTGPDDGLELGPGTPGYGSTPTGSDRNKYPKSLNPKGRNDLAAPRHLGKAHEAPDLDAHGTTLHHDPQPGYHYPAGQSGNGARPACDLLLLIAVGVHIARLSLKIPIC